MYFFDRVEKRIINGLFEVFAIDEQKAQSYLLRNVVISMQESTVDGLNMKIACYPEEYIYRGEFKTVDEMKLFSHNISKLFYEVSRKNSAVHLLNIE